MFHRTKSILSCLSLCTALGLGACTTGPDQTAQFSQANADELRAVATLVGLGEFASLAVPLVASFEGMTSGNGCPEVTATSIVGNGCMTPQGAWYYGSAEIEANPDHIFPTVTFHEFRRSEEGGFSFYLDGSASFTLEGDDELRYEVDLTIEAPNGIVEEFGQVNAHTSATCRLLDEDSASCTLEAGSTGHVDGLGGFTIEGTFPLGDITNNDSLIEVTARGADEVHIEYDGQTECMTYSIDGGDPEQLCGG